MKRATEQAKKEYLENICDQTTEFQITGCYDLKLHEDEGISLEKRSGYSNQRLSGEYNSTSKTCTEHLGELYYRSLKSSKPIRIPRS